MIIKAVIADAEIFIWIGLFFLAFGIADADSIIPTPALTLAPQKADQIESSVVPEGLDSGLPGKTVIRTIFDMDLLGNEEKAKFKIENKVVTNLVEGSRESKLVVQRKMNTGKFEPVARFRYPDVFDVQIDIAPLDPQTPKKSFLIVNCKMGSKLWDMHVYQWDGKSFQEVETMPYLWGHPKTMKDGVNVILAPTGTYFDEGPDIYIYQKGCLAPANYKYPEVYEKDIEQTLNDFDRKDWLPGLRIEFATRYLMKFLYAGRANEGMLFCQRIQKLIKLVVKDTEEGLLDRRIALFKAYAYLDIGKNTDGMEELKKICANYNGKEGPLHLRLGDYYYIKSDFKSALKYYGLASKELFKPDVVDHFYEKKIKILRILAGN